MNEEKLTDVLDSLVDFYKQKLAEGNLSATEQKNVIQLLRDNSINVDPKNVDPLEQIAKGDVDDINWEEFTEETMK